MRARMPLGLPRSFPAALGLLVLASSASAQGKAIAVSPYTLEQTFGTTLRLLRVDLGYEVTERDPQAAYLLFRYQADESTKRQVEGAVELVVLGDAVRVVVKIPSLPEAHERIFRDKLMRKLREDFGEPPKRKPPTKPDDPPKPVEPAPPGADGPGDAAKPRT